MDLIVNEVVQFEEVHISDGNGIVETLTRSSVAERYLAVDDLDFLLRNEPVELLFVFVDPLFVYPLKVFSALLRVNFNEYGFVFYFLAGIYISCDLCKFKRFRDLGLLCAVENRSHDLPSEFRRGSSEMDFKHLTDVHSGRNAERVKHDVERSSVFKERHILLRKNSRNNALVTVTSCHFVSDGNSSSLREINADDLVRRGRKLV